jgi:lysine-N-methylase
MKSMPIRSLPVWQHWDCQGCGNCCRDYQVAVTDAERERIAAQGWEQDPAIANQPLFVAKGPWWKRRWRLNHRKDGACVFLSEQGRCRIHEKFGSEAKPLACRVYPFILVAAGDQWRVGLRYACPSVAGDQGRPLAEHHLEGYAAELSRQTGIDSSEVLPPRLQLTQRVDWPDLARFVDAVVQVLRNREFQVETRLRHTLALANLCRKARFEKVQGARLSEFLKLVSSGLSGEVPADGTKLPAPTWVGRVLFRQVLALYTRKDQGQDVGPMSRNRLALIAAACRFALGRGPVPRGHAWIPETTFEALEEPAGRFPEAAEAVLERYYTLKVESLQFCGATNFGMSFWEGLAALALTLPVILWVARSQRDMPREQALIRAITMVDHNFGFNPLLGNLRQRYSLGILVQRGELERLIGWYSR